MTRQSSNPSDRLSRRELLAYTTAFGSAFVAAQGLAAEPPAKTKSRRKSPAKKYDMKKSINLWALPYPDKMSLRECFQLCKDAGFDGVEVNYALEGDLSPEVGPADIRKVGEMARKMGLAISGLCSFLFWPYSLTQNDPAKRKKGLELAAKMIEATKLLGTENLLVVPGAVYIPWLPDEPPVPPEVCDRRAREAMRRLIPLAEKAGVYLNIENICLNAFLNDAAEMNAFVYSFKSDHVQVHFDTGNCMEYQFPEHWIPSLGKRIKNTHLKEASKKVGETNWPAVIEALDRVGYRGYLTFEYFNPFPHWPESLIYQTSDAMDRMLGRKG